MAQPFKQLEVLIGKYRAFLKARESSADGYGVLGSYSRRHAHI